MSYLHAKFAADIVTVRVKDGSLLELTRAELEGSAWKSKVTRRRKIVSIQEHTELVAKGYELDHKTGRYLLMTPKAVELRRRAAEERELLNWWNQES